MMNDWQLDLFERISIKGIKAGEMPIMMSGRQIGKSQISAYARLYNDIMQGPAKVSDMRLSEGTVYGNRYHTVEPVGGNWIEMEQWCQDTFGQTTGSIWSDSKAPDPAQRWYMNNRKFWFRKESDRTLFVLRWS
jgi:hypothetical protein